MWTIEQNRCVSCAKVESCPDGKVIQKSLRQLLDSIDNNKGGSTAGMIVVICKDKDLTK